MGLTVGCLMVAYVRPPVALIGTASPLLHLGIAEVGLVLWSALWSDLVALMRAGLRTGRIVTTRPADRDRRTGRVRRQDAFYVNRRTGPAGSAARPSRPR